MSDDLEIERLAVAAESRYRRFVRDIERRATSDEEETEQTMYAIALAHYSKQSDIPAKVLKAIEVKLDNIINQEVVK